MKKADLYQFEAGLLATEFNNPKAAFAVAKNKRIVRLEIEAMEEAVKPSKKFEAFLEERRAIAAKHSRKDKNGKPVMILAPSGPPRFDIPDIEDKTSPFNKEIEELRQKHIKVVAAQEEREKAFNTVFLQEPSDVRLVTVSLGAIEGEKCPQYIMDKIHWMFNLEE